MALTFEERNRPVVQRAHEAFFRGDTVAFPPMLAEDVVWQTPSSSGERLGARRVGSATVADSFQTISGLLGLETFEHVDTSAAQAAFAAS